MLYYVQSTNLPAQCLYLCVFFNKGFMLQYVSVGTVVVGIVFDMKPKIHHAISVHFSEGKCYAFQYVTITVASKSPLGRSLGL